MKKIVLCYTVPDTFVFSDNIINGLKKKDFEMILVSSNDKQLKQVADSLGVYFFSVDFKRTFSFNSDMRALFQLVKFFHKTKPDLVIGATPKAALLSMIAGKLTRVPKRIYHVLGLPYETATGFKRSILLSVEKVTAFCSTHLVPVSNSLSAEYLSRFRSSKSKMNNFASLTIAGVDLSRFNPEKFSTQIDKLKTDLKIKYNSLVIGYVARLTTDKGIGDLIEAWSILEPRHSNLHLLVIGERDSRDPFSQEELDKLFDHNRVTQIPFTTEVEKFMAIMDIFILPSYREGFGNVNVEASSMLLPVISYDVTGCKDSVSDGISGYLVEKGNIAQLVEKIEFLINSELERQKIGQRGRDFVENLYSRERVASEFVDFCNSL